LGVAEFRVSSVKPEVLGELAPLRRKGIYLLLLHLEQSRFLRVGCLGRRRFPAGWYTYVGSAFGPGGLAARVGRHGVRLKACHWHIDYLRRHVSLHEIWISHSWRVLEHHWAEVLCSDPLAVMVMPGFGSSDCSCPSHLFHFRQAPLPDQYAALQMDHRLVVTHAPKNHGH
jgi:Uri superfamily endonuclease